MDRRDLEAAIRGFHTFEEFQEELHLILIGKLHRLLFVLGKRSLGKTTAVRKEWPWKDGVDNVKWDRVQTEYIDRLDEVTRLEQVIAHCQ